MDTGPRIDSYEWAGGREAMLRFGPDEGPVVVLALPLFEEANRCRAFGVSILRALGGRGVGGVLPELPGQGESTVGLATTTLLLQQEAVEQVVAEADATGRRCYAVGIRSGALLDLYGLFLGRWHLAPQQGGDLVRELLRTAKASGAVPRDGNLYRLTGAAAPTVIAGNPISGDMIAGLQSAEIYDQPGVPRRTVQLRTGARGDQVIEAAPPWRLAEPDNDLALAETLAHDIADWIVRCEG